MSDNRFVYGSKIDPGQAHIARAQILLNGVFEGKVPSWVYDVVIPPIYDTEMLTTPKLHKVFMTIQNKLRHEAGLAGVKKPKRKDFGPDEEVYRLVLDDYQTRQKAITQKTYQVMVAACAWQTTPEEMKRRNNEWLASVRKKGPRSPKPHREPKPVHPDQPIQPPLGLPVEPPKAPSDGVRILRPGDPERLFDAGSAGRTPLENEVIAKMRKAKIDDEVFVIVADPAERKRIAKNVYYWAKMVGWGDGGMTQKRGADGSIRVLRVKPRNDK